MRPPRAAALAVALAFPAAAALAADWPQFRGPLDNGTSPERGLRRDWNARPPRLLWKVAMGDDGYSGPSVAGGRLYIVDHLAGKDVLRALDARTGRDLWRYAYPDATRRVYGFTRATPGVRAGRVLIVSRLGRVLCLDARAGRLLWSRHLVKELAGRRPQWDYSMSVRVDGERAVVCPGAVKGCVAALDLRTGRTLWHGGGDDTPGYATPVAASLGGARQYVIFAGSSLRGLAAQTGRLLWSLPWMTQLESPTPSEIAHFNANAAAPVVSGDSLFITSGYGRGCALVDVAGRRAHFRWQSKEIQSHFSSPVLLNGYVYCTTDPGRLVCLEWGSGQPAWKQRGFEKGGLVAVDGALIVLDGRTGDAVLVEASPRAYRELGRFRPLGGESRTAPIVANGCLYVRNRKALACFSLR